MASFYWKTIKNIFTRIIKVERPKSSDASPSIKIWKLMKISPVHSWNAGGVSLWGCGCSILWSAQGQVGFWGDNGKCPCPWQGDGIREFQTVPRHQISKISWGISEHKFQRTPVRSHKLLFTTKKFSERPQWALPQTDKRFCPMAAICTQIWLKVREWVSERKEKTFCLKGSAAGQNFLISSHSSHIMESLNAFL